MASSIIRFVCLVVFMVLIRLSDQLEEEDQVYNYYEADRVSRLPGQPISSSTSAPLKLSIFAGYVNVNKEHDRNLFYLFFEAQTQSSKKPLILWLNGGPGCSSVAYGQSVELGPLKVKKNGVGLEFNKYAWNQEANMLFVESPVGVGFSYTNMTSDLYKTTDHFVAEHNYIFILNWFKKFPMYKTRDFFLAGESYAGHYVPQLAELIHDRNKDAKRYPFINLKGFIVGNPETDSYYDSKGLVEYAWSHAVISDDLYTHINKACNFKFLNLSQECSVAVDSIFRLYREIDIYNIYAPTCLLNTSSSTLSLYATRGKMSTNNNLMRTQGGYDPCYSPYVEDYFNRHDVQAALNVIVPGVTHPRWKVCNDPLFKSYNFDVFSVLPIYSKLIKAGLRIWIYSGDVDGRVPVIGTRYCVEALNLKKTIPWSSWYHKHQVAGRFVEYEGLMFVTVRGAGHLVPLNKPEEALMLISSFLKGIPLPTER